jgi:hypothetical protein
MRTKKTIQEPWIVEMETRQEGDKSLIVITLINQRTGECRLNTWTKEEAAILLFGVEHLDAFGKDGDSIIEPVIRRRGL